MRKPNLTFMVVLSAVLCSIYIHLKVAPTWSEQIYVYDTYTNQNNQLVYKSRDVETPIVGIVKYEQSPLRQAALDSGTLPNGLKQQWVEKDGSIVLLKPGFHFGMWSLLPAVIAIILCLLTREAMIALLMGIIVGAIMLGRYDITDAVLIPSLATNSAAFILLLYLWLLGSLMGVWSKTGAAQAFADFMTKHFVKGERSAKFIAWLLGVMFFQGGTVSTVIVGTTVKPLADEAKVSHEEMSYIVDSTASPIASILAFNAWPAYVQALIFVPGVAFLATETQRIQFFFASIPFSFYSILAVTGTLLLSFNITWHCGKRIKQARERVAKTGMLDAPNARPMNAKELNTPQVPSSYKPNVIEFALPLLVLIIIAIATFVYYGVPKVNWAFAAALVLSCSIALAKGMSLQQLFDGIGNGLKGTVVASVILLLAITIGGISKETGGALYLIELLGQQLPFWLLPVVLQVLTMVIAFSTGTSWGTYAIAFPLAMPLAWTICNIHGVEEQITYMAICFAAVLNGSVIGDQCSPISDTTILSSMTTGCDLMDHVKSQIVPASFAAILAGFAWTLCALFV